MAVAGAVHFLLLISHIAAASYSYRNYSQPAVVLQIESAGGRLAVVKTCYRQELAIVKSLL